MRTLTQSKLCNRSSKTKNLISEYGANKSKSPSGSRFGSGLPHYLQNGWSCVSAHQIFSKDSSQGRSSKERNVQAQSRRQNQHCAPNGAQQPLYKLGSINISSLRDFLFRSVSLSLS